MFSKGHQDSRTTTRHHQKQRIKA
uniref:Uncharacterized protein n=1 Tax=Arundo donax TaxID=35708 RepID=A0A0A9AEP2_ARUDO